MDEPTNLSISTDLGQPSEYQGQAKNLEEIRYDRNRKNLIDKALNKNRRTYVSNNFALVGVTFDKLNR